MIIDSSSGKVKSASVFDTYKSSAEFEGFIQSPDSVVEGDIVVAACRDDCVTALSADARSWF